MGDDAHDFQIIMEKVPAERQAEAALFLSGCFSLPPASTRGIAGSGPIALLTDLEQSQAEAILEELTPSLPEGVALRLAGPGEAGRVSRLQWPRPPRVYGSPLDEFRKIETGNWHLSCPHCGGALTVSPDGSLIADDGSSDKPRRSGETAVRSVPQRASDTDPLFSGIKPLDPNTSKYASIRSLQAGDTGFWMDYSQMPATPPHGDAADHKPGGTSNAKKSTGKISAGLAAFMKQGAYAVVVGRTRDSQAVKMIAEIMGISESDARERAQSLGLCIARDISLDEAQNLLARFRHLGARARIVRPSA